MTASEATERPVALAPAFDAIPTTLLEVARWVGWCYEWVGSEWTKVPRIAGNADRRAATDNPLTWRPSLVAIAAYEVGGLDGIGIVLDGSDDLSGVDLDHCRDPRSGVIEPYALEIVAALDSYTEVSPSGTGLRVFTFGRLPAGRRKGRHLEMYDSGRYLTVTGHRLEGAPTDVRERTAELAVLHAHAFPPERPRAETSGGGPRAVDLDDEDLLDRALRAHDGGKFARLWSGDAGDYGDDDSSADQALCNKLAFWTGGDIGRMDRLFRRSGLYRQKWERPDYRERTLRNALAWATDYYEPQPEIVRNGKSHTADDADGESAPTGPRGFHLTDQGNAERLADRHGADLRYCGVFGKWLGWDGCRWATDDTGAVVRRAVETVRSIYAEAGEAGDRAERKAITRWAFSSEARTRITSMVQLCQSIGGVAVHPDALDTDPWLLCAANGVLDLRTGELRPHRREDLISRMSPVAYVPGATCAAWDGFLARVLPDAAVRAFVRRWAGYCLTGMTGERAIAILHGRGRNGKSTFLETLAAMLGDYAMHTPASTLLEKRDGSIPNDLARLKGARFVWMSETEQGHRMNEALLKEVTGGDAISARFMRGEWFDFVPQFKPNLATNHAPIIRGSDHAVWDRIRLIPFTVRIADDEVDRGLRARLTTELSGILSWAVEGCLEWRRDGLGTADAITQSTDSYRAEMDVLGQFIDDCCVLDVAANVTASALYARYAEWCQTNGERRPLTNRTFGVSLIERNLPGVEPRKGTNGVRMWSGLRLCLTGVA